MAKVTLKNVRLSFPQLWTATGFNEKTPKEDYKYSAAFLVEKGSDNAKKIEAAIDAVATEKWKEKADNVLNQIRGNNNKFAYQDGDLKDYDGYAGHMSIKAATKLRPLLVDKARNPVTEDDGVLYAGCYVNAVIDVYAYDGGGNRGITAGLVGVQFAAEGDAFGAARPEAEDLFEDLAAGSGAEDFV